jgi:hypothetical protein
MTRTLAVAALTAAALAAHAFVLNAAVAAPLASVLGALRPAPTATFEETITVVGATHAHRTKRS